MPTYGYQCTECQHEFSVFQSMKDDPIKICPQCQGAVKRLLYPVGIVFKGSGWYVNDSRAPDKSESGESAKPAAESKGEDKSDTKTEAPAVASSDAAKSETPKSESKPEAASPAKTA